MSEAGDPEIVGGPRVLSTKRRPHRSELVHSEDLSMQTRSLLAKKNGRTGGAPNDQRNECEERREQEEKRRCYKHIEASLHP
jgi:hypothetical protein